jgi:hypothetical protein
MTDAQITEAQKLSRDCSTIQTFATPIWHRRQLILFGARG